MAPIPGAGDKPAPLQRYSPGVPGAAAPTGPAQVAPAPAAKQAAAAPASTPAAGKTGRMSLHFDGVHFRPVNTVPAHPVELYIVWRSDNDNPALEPLLDLVRHAFGHTDEHTAQQH